MKPARLLRWYPRAWRERYGEELLVLIQDTLDEGRPTWRLWLGVVRGGLRERAHQARHPSKATVKRLDVTARWLTMLVAGGIVAFLPGYLASSPPPARAGQATVALDVLLAVVALTGAVVLADGLAALPALTRFLQAGGWPKIRRRIARAAGATGAAGGGLVGLVLLSGSRSPAQLNASLPYSLCLIATILALAVAIGLWASAAAATARHITLVPRVRAAQLLLGAVTPTAVSAMVIANAIWLSVTQASVMWLLFAVLLVTLVSMSAPHRIRRAVRRGRRLRSAASRGR
jgi:hypothetical protein